MREPLPEEVGSLIAAEVSQIIEKYGLTSAYLYIHHEYGEEDYQDFGLIISDEKTARLPIAYYAMSARRYTDEFTESLIREHIDLYGLPPTAPIHG